MDTFHVACLFPFLTILIVVIYVLHRPSKVKRKVFRAYTEEEYRKLGWLIRDLILPVFTLILKAVYNWDLITFPDGVGFLYI